VTDQPDQPDRLRYRALTGPDDHAFCQRVSDALDDGYVLHGPPSITHGPEGPIVCQAVVLPGQDDVS
jgi:hypothetical protein